MNGYVALVFYDEDAHLYHYETAKLGEARAAQERLERRVGFPLEIEPLDFSPTMFEAKPIPSIASRR